MKIAGRRTLVTGATGGLGQAIARRLAGEGAHLVLTGRGVDVLERRNEADYAHAPVPTGEVAEAIKDARRFVTAVEAWIAAR